MNVSGMHLKKKKKAVRFIIQYSTFQLINSETMLLYKNGGINVYFTFLNGKSDRFASKIGSCFSFW